ncbi:SymE family type I addiction module toxin [Chitinophagaceae bacterium 26-R-25]|nr:SymE family type I addiction module toxin [Chitinophagaceae bacterium 26-R-25]
MNFTEKKTSTREATPAKPKTVSKKASNVRRAKISSRHYSNDSRSIFNPDKPSNVPYLRLSGDWLKRAGFPVAQYVNITISESKLIIEREI